MSGYIRGIGIQNFKAHSQYHYCEFSSISLLIGKNGAGKSSFLQAAQFVFKFLEKANPKWDEIVDTEYKIIDIDKIIEDDFFDAYDDFTSFSQIINDTSKPFIIDLVLDFGYDEVSFLICPLKYRFIFSVHDREGDLILVLDEFNIDDFEQKQRILTNDTKKRNEPFNMGFTKEGLEFLLASFLKYINMDDLSIEGTMIEWLSNPDKNTKKNSLKSKYQGIEKKLLYEIDEATSHQAIQSYRREHGFKEGESIVGKIKIFIGGIKSYIVTDSSELKDVLNVSYQAIKESFLIALEKIKRLEPITISKIVSRKRVFDKGEIYLKCFSNKEKLNQEFLQKSLSRFNFKGVPTDERISKEDTRYKVVLKNYKSEQINLIDEGSGYWILTYLIFKLGNENNRNKIILIEEPETFLHPNFQANLADLFIEAMTTFGHQLIIETHSEYLIRKLQYLTANKDISTEDTVIYYFYPPDNVSPGEEQVKKINIQEDGSLTDDFGTGFFDEADNIALELFLLKQNQKN